LATRGRTSKYQDAADLVLGLADLDEEERDNPDLILTPAREDALELWKSDPTGWSLLTAIDPETKEPIVKTLDQRDKHQTVKGFPGHLEYLHFLVDLLYNEPYVVIEKASQMVVTTTVALSSGIKCAIKPGYKVLLSKHSEEEAEIILDEKVRTPWSMMPGWVQRNLPLDKKPRNTITFWPKAAVKSVYQGLPENAAAAKARGQTYNIGEIDEAEFQEMLRSLITAMLPRCSQLFFWSTPSRGGDGVAVFRTYLADDPITIKKHPDLWAFKKKWCHVQGMSVRRNEAKNFTIVRIEHTADPAKRGEQWEREAKRGYPSEADFRREMKIDRTANAGKLYYPQFIENPRRFIVRTTQFPEPILRGWDFGGAYPACVWGSWSMKSKRFIILRELLGVDIDTYQFRDLVKYLSGQLSLESLQQHPRAMQMLDENIRTERAYPEPPWFEGKHKFLDFAGHEAVMGGRGLIKDSAPKSAAEILDLGDIHVYAQYTSQAARTEIVNGLSRMRDDGWPGLLFEPACPILIEGMFKQIVYQKATQQHPDPLEPAKDAIYSHLHEALGYILTNVVRLEDADYFQGTYGPDGQPILEAEPEMQISSYLCEGR
jgi:hypothetical protein